MNCDLYLGSAWIALGRIEECVGHLLSNDRCLRKGFELRMAGESRRAVGQARRIIARCRRASLRDTQRTESHGASGYSPAADRSLHNASLIALPWLGRS